MKRIYKINSKALLFGTDLPSTRARVPFSKKDVQLIAENFSPAEQDNIFINYALDWYGKRK